MAVVTSTVPAAGASPPPPARVPVGDPRPPGIPRLNAPTAGPSLCRGWNVEGEANRGDLALTAITEKHVRDLHAKSPNRPATGLPGRLATPLSTAVDRGCVNVS